MKTGQAAKKSGYSPFGVIRGVGLLAVLVVAVSLPSEGLMAALEPGDGDVTLPLIEQWNMAQATAPPTAAPGSAVVPPVRREMPQTPAAKDQPAADPAAAKPEVTPEASGVWGTIQEWLARANREYQGVVVKQLSLPPSGGSAGEDEIARKLKDEQADETRKAAEAKKLADEKAAAQATTEGAKALDADRKKAEETKRLADEAKKKADELFKTEKAEKAKLPEAPAAAPQPDEAALAAEQQKLEAERQAEEAKWQKAANDARHAEEQRKKAEAVAAATAEEDRRRATELAAAEKHRSRTIVITPEPIARPVDRGTSFRREMPSARWAADMADAEDTPSPAPQRRRIRVIRVIREATYRGIDPNAYRGTTVKRWVWRSNGSGCHAAGRRVTPPARYTIKRGDSLWRISERHYNAGRLYRKIYRANRSRIEDPDLIYPCQRVLVPR